MANPFDAKFTDKSGVTRLDGQVNFTDDANQPAFGGVRTAAAVPVAAPTTTLPFAYDTTAVTGGFYYWNGSAWVKIANIL